MLLEMLCWHSQIDKSDYHHLHARYFPRPLTLYFGFLFCNGFERIPLATAPFLRGGLEFIG